ncbi:MAG: DUF6607 family protein [Bacteroidota bacterium]
MKSYLILPLALLFATSLWGQDAAEKKAKDVAAIKSMCGCHSITFDYAETFPVDTAYKLHEPYHAAANAEWIFVDEETEDRLVIQHLLIVGGNMIIKHWRQDWVYEETDHYQFDGDLSWKYTKLPQDAVAGQWTQLVTQVDDSPRYVGSATWVHVDGKSYWENTSDAPLPRREFSKRSDYNVMRRKNRHQITDYGWLHDQDNVKILRKDGQDTPLVAEKGRNMYTRRADSDCEVAQKWWKKHRDFWRLVRAEWEDIYSQNDNLYMHLKIDEQKMYEKMFALDMEMAPNADDKPEVVREKVRGIIKQYLADEKTNQDAVY